MKLLIVDDQASARRVLSAIVGKLDDVEIEEADSLESARRAIENNALDVALLDLRLGSDARNRDGLVLVEEIRARTAIVPIIVTGYSEVAEIRQAMRVGAYDYILKDDLCDGRNGPSAPRAPRPSATGQRRPASGVPGPRAPHWSRVWLRADPG